MDFQATFSNQLGQAKTLDIKDGFNLQDAYNVVANDDFAPTQITLEPINMNSSDSNVEPDKQVETAYDLGRYSINDIIDKHKISSDELAVLLEEGTNHELEHTSSYLIAMKIAQDHLYEDLRYYSKLKEVMLARGAAIESAKFKNGELENQKIIDVAKSVVLALGEIYSENDYLGKCKEISEEISNRLNNLNINAIPMRIIEGEDTKYNSLVFNHAYTFLPDKNYIVDTQLWQLERNMDDLSQRKVLFSFDEYNKIVKLYDVEPIDDWEERFRQGGLIAPNGKSSNLTAEQYKMVRTPEFKDGGDVDNKKYYRAVTQDLGLQTTFVPKNRYEAFDIEGNPITRGASDVFMLSDKLEISASKSVGGAILGLWSMYNSNGINPVGKKVYVYAITNKPYKDLSGVRMADFEYLKEVRYDKPISANRVGYFEYDEKFNEDALNFYGRISDDDPYSEMEYDIDAWEDFEHYILTLNISDLVIDGKNPDIRFDKGGYVSEEVLIENNIGKIDDIYVFSENDEPVKSLGEFTLQGFGKYMMKDLAGELYSDYKIRLRSDFAIMLGNDVIKPSIKVAQMKGNRIEILAIIYNAMVSEEQAVSYVYDADGEVVGKFTDEDFAEDMVNNNDGYYSEVRVEELETPETILAMQFDFNKHEMTFISTLLEKQSTHKFKYGGKM